MMPGLQALLLRKIIITAVFWCLPLLLLPHAAWLALGIPLPASAMLFCRLLGAAYAALLVGYALARQGLRRGENPWTMLHVGLASNGLAGAWLLYFGSTGAWSDWGRGAQVLLLLSALGALAMTLQLWRFRARVRQAWPAHNAA